MTLTEGTLQITFNGAVSGRKFDDRAMHGLTHCMKAVDFIVEFPASYLFVEIKDPGAPQVSSTSAKDFQTKFNLGEVDESLKYKFRDSFLYEWASGRADKPIDYYVLITGIRKRLLIRRIDVLKRNLPLNGPNAQPWKQSIVRNVSIFDMQTWNRNLPRFPVVRV